MVPAQNGDCEVGRPGQISNSSVPLAAPLVEKQRLDADLGLITGNSQIPEERGSVGLRPTHKDPAHEALRQSDLAGATRRDFRLLRL